MQSSSRRPVIIIGTGPAGMGVAEELTRIAPGQQVLLFGGEPWRPYDRIQLSSLLAGNVRVRDMSHRIRFANSSRVVEYHNHPIREINREERYVSDWQGRLYRYSHLVLATGSKPLTPDIPGIELPGVFTFRNLDDALRLMARQIRTRSTVVIGGGLLGLEAAKAMRRHNTRVRVVERSDRLMPQQLDAGASEFFTEHVLSQGIDISLETTVAAIEGEDKVERVWLEDGSEISCDTVIVAAGIQPNVELAVAAGLEVGRGIRTGNDMRTSDPHILAVGECAEHNGIVYGLAAPGIEQARVAAHVMAGENVSYVGTVAATKLKVFGADVYSLGEVQNLREGDRQYVWRSSRANIYRKLVVRDGRAVGVISIGNWPALPRVQDFVNQHRRVLRNHVQCFQRTGFIWSPEGQPEVIHWPETATVCNCTGATRGQLGLAIRQGCHSVAALAEETRASTICGSCRPLLEELVSMQTARMPLRALRRIAGLRSAGALASLRKRLLRFSTVAGTPVKHHLVPAWASRIRNQVTWLHLLIFLPLPVVLGLHILRTLS